MIRPARNAYRDLVGKPYGKHIFPRIGHTGNAYGIAMGRPLIKDLLPVIAQPKNVYSLLMGHHLENILYEDRRRRY